jgi:pilus assembly protein TadC
MLAAWVQHSKQTKEGYAGEKKILGLAKGVFFTLLVISFVLWIVALVLLVKNAHLMPTWAIALSIAGLLLISGGSIMTIVLALYVRDDGKKSRRKK